MKLRLTEKPTVRVRDDAAVVVFPSRPYWFSATKEIGDVLSVLGEEIDESEAVPELAERLGATIAEATETLAEIRDLLYENSVLLIDGQASIEAEPVEPHFQVNPVENVLVIGTTMCCNLECPHCSVNAKAPLPGEMTTLELKALIDHLASMPWNRDISRVGLTGGELFTRSDALELIDYVHAKGFKVVVASNALLLTDQMIAQLATYNGFRISVSLDGPNAESHERIRGKGTFEPTVAVIRKLAASGVSVGVNMVIHRDNIDLIGDTLKLADDLGAKAFNCLRLMRIGRARPGSGGNCRLVGVLDRVLYRKLFSILRGNARYRELMHNSTFACQVMGVAAGVRSDYCGIGTNRALYVRSDGCVYPCPNAVAPEFLLGNVKTDQLWDIWKNSPILRSLRQLSVDTMNPKCAQCDVRYFCGGSCRGENHHVTKNLQSPHYNCKDNREAIFEIMWMLTEDPEFFQDKVANLYQTVCF